MDRQRTVVRRPVRIAIPYVVVGDAVDPRRGELPRLRIEVRDPDLRGLVAGVTFALIRAGDRDVVGLLGGCPRILPIIGDEREPGPVWREGQAAVEAVVEDAAKGLVG